MEKTKNKASTDSNVPMQNQCKRPKSLLEKEQTGEVDYILTLQAANGSVHATYFRYAAEGDYNGLVSLLNEGHVAVNDVDADGFSALMIAAADGQEIIVEELLNRKANVMLRTHELRSTALHFAAKNGNPYIVDAICQYEPQQIDCRNINSDTPLIWACIEAQDDAVRVLLEYGADTNAVNQYGATPLISAVMIGENPQEMDSDIPRSEIVEMLLTKNKSLLNYQDQEASTAMHLAASCGYIECVQKLLEFGADITLRNAIGQTPLEEAEAEASADRASSSKDAHRTIARQHHVRLCIDLLRTIWKKLEDEATARMMAMLELEETVAPTTTSKKKNKKNKKKRKQQQKVPTPQVTVSKENLLEEPNEDLSHSSSSDVDDEATSKDRDHNFKDKKTDWILKDSDVKASAKQGDVSEVWTTVGKRNRGSITPNNSIPDSSEPIQKITDSEKSEAKEKSSMEIPPVNVQLEHSLVMNSSMPDNPESLLEQSLLHQLHTPTFTSSASRSTEIKKNYSTQRRLHSNRTSSGHIRPIMSKWKKRIEKMRQFDETFAEALTLLSCGVCGELVSDNLQCSNTIPCFTNRASVTDTLTYPLQQVCTQLYCSQCVNRLQRDTSFCVKCNQLIQNSLLQHNHLAQAQAASLGLSQSHHLDSEYLNQRSIISPPERLKIFYLNVPKAEAVDLKLHHLTPGYPLDDLSCGQLDVLMAAHEEGLRQVIEQQVQNARVIERLRCEEEWIKTLRLQPK